MNDGVLVVNFAALGMASDNIEKALNTLDSQLRQLELDAKNLMGTWDGQAKEAYEQRQAQWRTASQDLRNILRDIKIAVDDSAIDYRNTEKANTGLFQ